MPSISPFRFPNTYFNEEKQKRETYASLNIQIIRSFFHFTSPSYTNTYMLTFKIFGKFSHPTSQSIHQMVSLLSFNFHSKLSDAVCKYLFQMHSFLFLIIILLYKPMDIKKKKKDRGDVQPIHGKSLLIRISYMDTKSISIQCTFKSC